MNTDIMQRLDQMQSDLNDVRALAEEQAAQPSTPSGIDLNSDPAVQQAAVALAEAVARSQGFELPLQVAGGMGELPVLTLPEEFTKYGGIGVSVVVAPPTEAAGSASAASARPRW